MIRKSGYSKSMFIEVSGVKIIGSGSAVSEHEITNKSLYPETAAWVESKLGILERRLLTVDENLIDLVVEASHRAMKNSKIQAANLDAIIVATSTPDYINPSMASLLHGRIGASAACASYDIQAVCAGFVYALANVAALIAAKAGTHFLIVGADQFSKITDFQDRNCVFFGDGAGALVIKATEGNSQLTIEINTEGAGWNAFHTPARKPKFQMNSNEVSKNAKTKLPASIRSVCTRAGISVSDIDLFVTHQPSKPVLDALENELMLESGKLLRNIAYRGNTAGATIPLLFDEAKVISRMTSGQNLCFAAIGSGWVWGSAILKWE